MFVFPVDGSDMTVLYGNPLPGSGRLEVGNLESGGIGGILFSRLGKEGLELFQLVLVDFLGENTHATQHERNQ